LDYCDPAANNSNFSTKATSSSVAILRTHGINPGFSLWERSIQMGIALINRFLQKKDPLGRPCFRIDVDCCPILYRAMQGGYMYPQAGQGGNPDEPMKGTSHQDFDYSHICDSFRYPFLNIMRLLRTEHEAAKKNLPKSGTKLNPKSLI
jgi:hypothetical protein